MVLQQIYEGLVTRNPDLSPAPGLATSWSQEEPTCWRFNLRGGVRFHGGEPFTAEDVVFSVARAQQPTSNFGIFVDTIDRAVAVDERTVDIITKVPDPILPNKIISVYMMSKGWSEAHNVPRPQNTRAREETYTVRNTNGTGPYRLASREPDVRTVLARNEAWWGWRAQQGEQAPGNVTEIVFRPIGSDATRIAALLSGEVDFVLDPPLQDLNRLRSAAGTKVLEGPEVRSLYIVFDVFRDELLYSDVKGRNPFKDLRVRQALYHAIDIQAIHRTTMRGQSVVTGTLFPEQVNGYAREEDVRLPYDAAKARALLAEAGYPNGFSVTLDCPNNRYINDEQICQAITAMWARAGVRVSLRSQPIAPFFAQIQRDDTSLYLLGWGVPTLDALYSFQSLLATRDRGPGDGIWNFGRYSNARMDELIARMKSETGGARQAAIREALRLYREDVPQIPLHHQMIPWAMRTNLAIPHAANNQPYFRWAVMN
jgi:peptide/nickel transport system substrate-binding protein